MISRNDCLALDAADGLAFARARFALPDGLIYLDGNSLGALPRRTATRVADTVTREWGEGLIRSWNDAQWIDAPAKIGAKIARLVGAAGDEVIVTDSVSVNIFKLAAAALALRPGRRVIVTEAGNFPTDVYVLQGLAALTGIELRVVERDAIPVALDETVALLLLTQTHYRTGAVHDMAALTAAAHAAGALACWDLSHSAGAIAVELDAAQADMAVGCGYKFLNGGPGAPAFAYVARRHHDGLRQPLSGWMGHAAPFAFEGDYRPAAGIAQVLSGTPGVLGMAALGAGVATFDGIDMAAAAAKSRALGDLMIDLIEQRCPEIGIACPRDHRGAHVSLSHPNAYELCQALIARGVIGDFRPPDVLRLGFPALYVRHADVWDAVEYLSRVLASGEWREERFAVRRAVT
ncbi:kynureninase [Polymorphobacter sp. PAMC 29334]|uniref:kynureninase n=1 Tax=Polymorphobacter sp. PAMC 29334 TaxID=2862331 RepID=UPI001C74F476|nr:kynureninase [Polymorphobacter sp. PAMC 29334]QYE34523.1 kynureninase [Polymorphobacter sp. PAMC 29334]